MTTSKWICSCYYVVVKESRTHLFYWWIMKVTPGNTNRYRNSAEEIYNGVSDSVNSAFKDARNKLAGERPYLESQMSF